MARELSQAELKTVFAALVDAATLVQALRRNNEVLDHLHISLNYAVSVLAASDIQGGHAKGKVRY